MENCSIGDSVLISNMEPFVPASVDAERLLRRLSKNHLQHRMEAKTQAKNAFLKMNNKLLGELELDDLINM